MAHTHTSEIKEFIVSNFLFGQQSDKLTDDVSFLESGIIDSTGLLELVSFIERQYGITVDDAELVPGKLDSLRNVSHFVTRKLEATAGTAIPTRA